MRLFRVRDHFICKDFSCCRFCVLGTVSRDQYPLARVVFSGSASSKQLRCYSEHLAHNIAPSYNLCVCVSYEFNAYGFVFVAVSVESTGARPPEVLVSQAVLLLEKKCNDFLLEIDASELIEDDK